MAKIFVFGSNEAGIHGAGAAKTALEKHGAVYGKGYGHHGKSFAIPTKDLNVVSLPLININLYVNGFIAHAMGHYKDTFIVTRIGCGLAGFTDEQIAPMFKGSPRNVQFDLAWKPYLGDYYEYWGTFGQN